MTVIAEGIKPSRNWPSAGDQNPLRAGLYFSKPIFLEDLRPATPLASEARASLSSRPAQESRPAYSRAGSYRR